MLKKLIGGNAVGHIRRLPWREIRRGINLYRSLFPKPWPKDAPTLVVEMDHNEWVTRLREDDWEKTPFTVKYKGEETNLRTPVGLDKSGKAREIHARSRETRNRSENESPPGSATIEIEVHEEYSRYEHYKLHLTKGQRRLPPDEAIERLPLTDDDVIERRNP
jgi:hypothetical protein